MPDPPLSFPRRSSPSRPPRERRAVPGAGSAADAAQRPPWRLSGPSVSPFPTGLGPGSPPPWKPAMASQVSLVRPHPDPDPICASRPFQTRTMMLCPPGNTRESPVPPSAQQQHEVHLRPAPPASAPTRSALQGVATLGAGLPPTTPAPRPGMTGSVFRESCGLFVYGTVRCKFPPAALLSPLTPPLRSHSFTCQ